MSKITIPVHILRPSKEMKAKGFTQPEESVCIQQMESGKLAVFPASVMRKERPYPYAVFESYEKIKESFEVVSSTNPKLAEK